MKEKLILEFKYDFRHVSHRYKQLFTFSDFQIYNESLNVAKTSSPNIFELWQMCKGIFPFAFFALWGMQDK